MIIKGNIYGVFLIVSVLVLTSCQIAPNAPSSSSSEPYEMPKTGSVQPSVPVLDFMNQTAILGRWRQGLPDKCPPSMDEKLYEQLKQLPDNKTYYLEFLDNGTLLYKDYQKNIFFDGTYRFIDNNNVEIIWNAFVGSFAWEALGGHGVYEVTINGNTMSLRGGRGLNASYIREN